MQVRVGRLNSITEIKQELVRIYRIARRNAGTDLDVQAVSKLATILGGIGKAIESSELDKRIERLEAQQAEK